MFRNLTLFRFSPNVSVDTQRLSDVIGIHRLRACGPMEMATQGFVSPLGRGNDALSLRIPGFTWLTPASEEKLLPKSVIDEALAERIQYIAEEENRRVGGKERKRHKDEIIATLLPRAFAFKRRTDAYLDHRDGWLVIDTTSRKVAENGLSAMREALGSFPAVPLFPGRAPREIMTGWLNGAQMPTGLALGDECELRDPAGTDGAIAAYRRQEMETDEVRECLRNGKQVFRLGLVFDDRLSFVLGEDLVVRKLQFFDNVLDELENPAEEAADEATARFALMTGELRALLSAMAQWFEIPRPSDDITAAGE